MTGAQCDDEALFRAGPEPGVETTAYARLAVTYQALEAKDLIPGVEGRFGVEGLFGAKAVVGRFSLFGTPVGKTGAARVGVAFDLAYSINRESSAVSRWQLTPLVFVGATVD